MKKIDPPIIPSEHPDALLFSYVEGTLDPQQRVQVEEHLNRCSECASEADDLRRIASSLRSNKRAFCPKPLELYHFARGREDATGTLREHVNECPLCAQELREYEENVTSEVMAPELWQQVKDRLPEAVPDSGLNRKIEGEPRSLRERLFGWFTAPAVAVAAAAAVLLVVFFYPRPLPEHMIGLSSVIWEGAPRPKAGPEAARKPAAYLIVFKKMKQAFPQAQIDALYSALQPDLELSERYRILPPADVRRSLVMKGVRVTDPREGPEKLGKDLGVETLLVITITPKEDKFTVEAQLFDVATGNTLREKTMEAVSLTDLASRIRETTSALML